MRIKRIRVSNKQLYETWDLFKKKLESKLGYPVNLFVPGGGMKRKIYNPTTDEDIVVGNNGVIQRWIMNKIRETKGKQSG